MIQSKAVGVVPVNLSDKDMSQPGLDMRANTMHPTGRNRHWGHATHLLVPSSTTSATVATRYEEARDE